MKNFISLDSVYFQHFSPFYFSFSWQIIHLKNVDVYTFWGGAGGVEKVYVLYTHLNVDNYGRPLEEYLCNCLPIFPFYFIFLFLSTLWNKSGKDPRNNTSIKSGLIVWVRYCIVLYLLTLRLTKYKINK